MRWRFAGSDGETLTTRTTSQTDSLRGNQSSPLQEIETSVLALVDGSLDEQCDRRGLERLASPLREVGRSHFRLWTRPRVGADLPLDR